MPTPTEDNQIFLFHNLLLVSECFGDKGSQPHEQEPTTQFHAKQFPGTAFSTGGHRQCPKL